MGFTERSKEWLHAQQPPQQPPASPMFVDGASRVHEGVPEPQASVGLLLASILEELRRMNNTPRESAQASSCEVKFLANGTPQPTVKAYADSPVPVDEAIAGYGAAFRAAEAGQMARWVETVEALQP